MGIFFFSSPIGYWSIDQKKTENASVYPGGIDGILWFAAFHKFKEFFGSTCSCVVGAKKWEILGLTASLYSAIFSIALFVMAQFFLKKRN